VPYHPIVQAILEVAKTIVVITQKLAGRNRGRVGHHLGHAAFVDHALAETGRAGRCDFGDGQGATGMGSFAGIARRHAHQGSAHLGANRPRGFRHGFQAGFHDFQ